MTSKLYQSKEWMRMKHHLQKLSVEEIAKICGVEPMTIRRALEKHALKVIKK